MHACLSALLFSAYPSTVGGYPAGLQLGTSATGFSDKVRLFTHYAESKVLFLQKHHLLGTVQLQTLLLSLPKLSRNAQLARLIAATR